MPQKYLWHQSHQLIIMTSSCSGAGNGNPGGTPITGNGMATFATSTSTSTALTGLFGGHSHKTHTHAGSRQQAAGFTDHLLSPSSSMKQSYEASIIIIAR